MSLKISVFCLFLGLFLPLAAGAQSECDRERERLRVEFLDSWNLRDQAAQMDLAFSQLGEGDHRWIKELGPLYLDLEFTDFKLARPKADPTVGAHYYKRPMGDDNVFDQLDRQFRIIGDTLNRIIKAQPVSKFEVELKTWQKPNEPFYRVFRLESVQYMPQVFMTEFGRPLYAADGRFLKIVMIYTLGESFYRLGITQTGNFDEEPYSRISFLTYIQDNVQYNTGQLCPIEDSQYDHSFGTIPVQF